MKQWVLDKWGRIMALLGASLAGLDGFDISPIKGSLEDLIGHKLVVGLTVALFVLSYIRHQQAANKINRLEQEQR